MPVGSLHSLKRKVQGSVLVALVVVLITLASFKGQHYEDGDQNIINGKIRIGKYVYFLL